MKKLFFYLLIGIPFLVSSQETESNCDSIIFPSGRFLLVKVVSINDSNIKYYSCKEGNYDYKFVSKRVLSRVVYEEKSIIFREQERTVKEYLELNIRKQEQSMANSSENFRTDTLKENPNRGFEKLLELDTVKFVKSSSKESFILNQGEKIRVKTLNKSIISGVFDSIINETLYLSRKNILIKVSLDSLKKLSTLPKKKINRNYSLPASLSIGLIATGTTVESLILAIPKDASLKNKIVVASIVSAISSPFIIFGVLHRHKKIIRFNKWNYVTEK